MVMVSRQRLKKDKKHQVKAIKSFIKKYAASDDMQIRGLWWSIALHEGDSEIGKKAKVTDLVVKKSLQ